MTVKTISVAVDADDVTWSLQSPSRDEGDVGKGRLLRHQLITFGAEMGREKVSLHSFSLAIEHV